MLLIFLQLSHYLIEQKIDNSISHVSYFSNQIVCSDTAFDKGLRSNVYMCLFEGHSKKIQRLDKHQ